MTTGNWIDETEGMARPELRARPQWRRTGNAYFPVAALVDGEWWVLRINNFPDQSLWTLFVNGDRHFDIDDAPSTWGQPADKSVPLLEKHTAEQIVAPMGLMHELVTVSVRPPGWQRAS